MEMMKERGLSISHTTIMRWVHQYGPELDKRIRRHLKQTNDSWRVDETYIKVKGQWMYLYRFSANPVTNKNPKTAPG
ncbi:integrase [Bacillus cereus]|nr:integrase [Bacillus cereus]